MACKVVVRNGHAVGVYDDRWSSIYDALGVLEVARASNVEFERGVWVARLANDGKVIAALRVRSEVIKAEIEYLERGL